MMKKMFELIWTLQELGIIIANYGILMFPAYTIHVCCLCSSQRLIGAINGVLVLGILMSFAALVVIIFIPLWKLYIIKKRLLITQTLSSKRYSFIKEFLLLGRGRWKCAVGYSIESRLSSCSLQYTYNSTFICLPGKASDPWIQEILYWT